MSGRNIDEIIQRQGNTSFIRNLCIQGHVDHGKTTLADSLIVTTGLISQKLAGKIRYMDYRRDEQEKGITVKSSSITLHYVKKDSGEHYIFNLIDTPGHVDFSSEVSAAVRLSDGVIILVDVVEGVCAQTRACLEQAHKEHVKPILVINKIDRLILEKQMTPLDAYVWIAQLLEQVNAVVGNIFAADALEKEMAANEDRDVSALEFQDDSNLYFAPEKLNVVFCSAIDGWAFTVRDFAKIYSDKLNISIDELSKVVWGDYFYSTKQKCPLSGAQERGKEPMFVKFVLNNIWELYDVICIRKDKTRLPDIAAKLGINLTSRDLRSTDIKSQLHLVLSQWLPIHEALLETAINIIPSPNNLPLERFEGLVCPTNIEQNAEETQKIKGDFLSCDPSSSNVIVFISKMVPFEKVRLPQDRPKNCSKDIEKQIEFVRHQVEQKANVTENGTKNPNEDQVKPEAEITQELIALGRVFSGTLKRGMQLFALSTKGVAHKERVTGNDSFNITEVTIGQLYLFMGSELKTVTEVPAGNIVGIGGLQNTILKTATITNNINCPLFSELKNTVHPILKVVLEPVNISEMPKLLNGLKLLHQVDACVQVSIEESGEHSITTLGEVHLEKCVRDLEEVYAKIKLHVSYPIVSFRETIVTEQKTDMKNSKTVNADNNILNIVNIQTTNNFGSVKLAALPLSSAAIEILEQNTEIIRSLHTKSTETFSQEKLSIKLKRLKKILLVELEALKLEHYCPCEDLIEKVWSVGPKKYGTNILLNLTDYKHPSFWKRTYGEDMTDDHKDFLKCSDVRRGYNSSFVNGFQLATAAGPLCEEPMYGVIFLILDWKIAAEDTLPTHGSHSGQILSAVKEGCRKAFEAHPQRLVGPIYTCDIIVNSEMLGKTYAVISRRNGKILSSDLIQGSNNFAVKANLPVIDSLDFVQEIRKQTSGLACPHLHFSHWEVLDIDPFWEPASEEECLKDATNRAKQYMNCIRKRKGLIVEEEIVENAEKQRTLSKNK